MSDLIKRQDAVEAVLEQFPEIRTREQAENVFEGIPSAGGVVRFCDVIDDCEDCPKYGRSCDGDKR